jgi:RimJ/RimL family protein N-acetyltransferase
MAEFRIETERLVLRDWCEDDRAPFYRMSSDPRVMATLGPVLTRKQSDALIDRVQQLQADDGCTFWAVERAEDTAFIGWCGIVIARGELPIAGKPEIGWRFVHQAWGQGYALEAATASLEWGFSNLSDDSIWAITAAGNTRSWGLMQRLGMVRHPNLDFDHPNVPDGSPLKRHVTYSIERDC